ncbi:MAG: efflux RND transporter periplasmic adaptor subunit [Acidobacteria bacterium]|nr:efflux RND transporter periplasmic adaptor subunit [Acidobacteriota bacterium]
MTRAALLPLLLLGLACGAPPEDTAETAAAADPATGIVTMTEAGRAAAGIATAPVRETVRTDALEALGVVSLDERRTARLGAIVDGVVAEVLVQPGDRVEEGAVLALILSHQIHDVWAEYFSAIAHRQEAEVEFDYARAAESRAERLLNDKALAEQEFQRARADRVAAEEALAAARAEVRRTEQDLQHYGLTPGPDADPRENEHVPVRAPFAGAVIDRLVSPGEAVTLGAPPLVVSDLSRVWITAEVPEADLHRLSAPEPVEFRVSAWPDDVFAATLTTIGDVINPATRRVMVRAEADNADGRLKPEMFATLTVASGTSREILVVPAAAVQELAGEPVVFVETGPGEFQRRRVVAGAAFDGDIEIREGLTAGELVVTEGAFLLKSALIGLPEEE